MIDAIMGIFFFVLLVVLVPMAFAVSYIIGNISFIIISKVIEWVEER